MWCASRRVARSIQALSWLVPLGFVLASRVQPAAAEESPPAAIATELKLPADIVYTGASTDSAVVFSHESHVAFAENHCTACHPQTFPMLRRGPAPTHQTMNGQHSCGTCHDGKRAFGVQDATMCSTCHAGAAAAAPPGTSAAATAGAVPAGRKIPAPHAYPSDGSPGTVTFRHESHLKGATSCTACHPKLFKMVAAPPLPGGGMHEASACGACHDGTRSFAATDDAACTRCHVETGARP